MKYLFLIIAILYTMLIAYFMKPVPDQIDMVTIGGIKYGVSLNASNIWAKLSLIFLWIGFLLYWKKR